MEPVTPPVPSRRDAHGLRRRTVVLHRAAAELRDSPDEVDLELAAELFNSGVLTAEISAANPEPELAV
jgi:hypothetical protein